MCVETAETEGGDKHTQDRRRRAGGGEEEAQRKQRRQQLLIMSMDEQFMVEVATSELSSRAGDMSRRVGNCLASGMLPLFTHPFALPLALFLAYAK